MQGLIHGLKEWESLTLSESKAIDHSDWVNLKYIQEKKSKLQAVISNLISELKTPLQSSMMTQLMTSKHEMLNPMIEHLVALESANFRELNKRIDEVKLRHSELKQTGVNLKRIRKAYSSKLAPRWQHIS